MVQLYPEGFLAKNIGFTHLLEKSDIWLIAGTNN